MARPATFRHDAIEALVERVIRLDARVRQSPGQLSLDLKGKGKPCGDGHIRASYTCRKGAATAPAAKAPAAGPSVSLDASGNVLINGKPPKKALGGGAYGDTFMAETPDGPVVVKVDRLKNQDPMERDYNMPQEQQRRNMVERERANMQKAHQLGLAPEPLGPVQQLSDGRLAFAYRMAPGVKLAEDHRAMSLTPASQELLAKPGALGNYAKGIGRIARAMADAGFEHGDMHGGNMVLAKDGSPTLIDWGYASDRPSKSAAETAIAEANSLMVLGGNLVSVNGPVDRRGVGRGVKSDINHALRDVVDRAREADRVYQRTIDEYEFKWHDDPANEVKDFTSAIKEANRLRKELGLPFVEAERRVGLQPVIPPEVEARAAAERDRIFGTDRLRRFRRAVDQHYAAWKDHTWTV